LANHFDDAVRDGPSIAFEHEVQAALSPHVLQNGIRGVDAGLRSRTICGCGADVNFPRGQMQTGPLAPISGSFVAQL
jgi:hypothetical protein